MYALLETYSPGDFTPEPDIAILEITTETLELFKHWASVATRMKSQYPNCFKGIFLECNLIRFIQNLATLPDTIQNWWPLIDRTKKNGYLFMETLPEFLANIMEQNLARYFAGCIAPTMEIYPDVVSWHSSYQDTGFIFRTAHVPFDKLFSIG